jgi:RHS repeat-associated protein
MLTYGGSSYTYDQNGYLATRTSTPGTEYYYFDALGSFYEFYNTAGDDIYFSMNGGNKLSRKEINANTIYYLISDKEGRIAAETTASIGTIIKEYVYATGSNSPDFIVGHSSAGEYAVIKDHLGSPRLIVNVADGTVAQRLDYNDLGAVTNDTNPGFQKIGFAGGVYDSDSQTVRFGARTYDVRTGRWTAKDPIRFAAAGTNLYGYALNDPVNLIDSDGKDITVHYYGNGDSYHIGISVNGGQSMGYYPIEGSVFRGATGQMLPDTDEGSPTFSVTISTSAAQDQAALDYINSLTNPQANGYNVFTSNCAIAAGKVLKAAGVSAPGGMVTGADPYSFINALATMQGRSNLSDLGPKW